MQRSDWKGHVTGTKGGRVRYVPMTMRLARGATESIDTCGGERVLCQDDGAPAHAEDRAGPRASGGATGAGLQNAGVHVLRHTFCSHLAMRGAPARAIQELAGHKDLATTQRYMHLSPAAIESAIRLLDEPGNPARVVETLWRRRYGECAKCLGTMG